MAALDPTGVQLADAVATHTTATSSTANRDGSRPSRPETTTEAGTTSSSASVSASHEASSRSEIKAALRLELVRVPTHRHRDGPGALRPEGCVAAHGPQHSTPQLLSGQVAAVTDVSPRRGMPRYKRPLRRFWSAVLVSADDIDVGTMVSVGERAGDEECADAIVRGQPGPRAEPTAADSAARDVAMDGPYQVRSRPDTRAVAIPAKASGPSSGANG